MAKRFEPFKEFGRSMKRPKLDIIISKDRSGPSQRNSSSRCTLSSAPATNAAQRPESNFSKPSFPEKSSPNNFWDDDDDDVILLATQVAETKVAAPNKDFSDLEMTQEFKQSELVTFSEFVPNLHATTSTQKLPQVTPAIPDPDLLADMFNDDDDEAFAMLVCEDAETKHQKKHKQTLKEADAFKRPVAPTLRSDANDKTQGPLLQVTQANDFDAAAATFGADLPSSQSAVRRQLASERQIKFLMERVDALKKENMRLSKDLTDTKAKVLSKDGESSLLRDELRNMKQQIQSLKVQKIFSTEAAKSECKAKITELCKQVEAKQTELKFKSVEYSTLKMRHADETRRLEISMQTQQPQKEASAAHATTSKKRLGLLKYLHGLSLDDFPTNPVTVGGSGATVDPDIFEPGYEPRASRKQRTLYQLELEKLQTVLAQVQLSNTTPVSTHKKGELHDQIIASVCKVFPEFWTYVHSLEYLKNYKVIPYHEYDLQNDQSDKQRRNIHQVQELYAQERALSLRRYIACLSALCRLMPHLTKSLLRYQHGEYMLLQIAIDAINKLGYSREICGHFGLLEAFAALLHSMLQHFNDEDEKSSALLVGLLKSLIFCRPSPWVFERISDCILLCRLLPYTLSLFCVNSDPQTFSTNRVHSVYRFSTDSCLLQVYAGLLEIAFPLYTPLRQKHFKLLSLICERHVRFIHHCFEDPPEFIRDHLPNYEDEEEDEGESDAKEGQQLPMEVESNAATVDDNQPNLQDVPTTSDSATNTSQLSTADASRRNKSSSSQCHCYPKLCLSLVTLLFQLLRQWRLSERKQETLRIEQISRISVKLLHTIFCDNFIMRLFREAATTTKHYLYLLCTWWSESSELLHFGEIEMKFLDKLRKSHIMPKHCHKRRRSNVQTDLAEWYCVTNERNEDVSVDKTSASGTRESISRNLRLMEDAFDEEIFFGLFKGNACNFEQ